jgi:precorrin-2 methylase
MSDHWRISNRMASMKKSAIHEMIRLSKENQDVAFLSWGKPTRYKVRKKSEIQISKYLFG